MSKQIVIVPDIGTDGAAEVAEVLVSEGDILEVEQSVLVLETDKASVEVPSSHAGRVTAVLVKEGDELQTGAAILEIDTSAGGESTEAAKPEAEEKATKEKAEEPAPQQEAKPAAAPARIEVTVPDIGDAADVEVIELSVKEGDEVQEGDSILVLESDKASMEIPSSAAGQVIELLVKEGDTVKQGQVIAVLQSSGSAPGTDEPKASSEAETKAAAPSQPAPAPAQPSPLTSEVLVNASPDSEAYAGPAVRKLARQLDVDLRKVKGSGPRGRITKEDLRAYVREALKQAGKGAAIPAVPAVDFARFGEIKRVKMSKIQRATAANMHRAWLNVPHVTQFDDADITELEAYRKAQKAEAEKRGVKLTPLAFLIKACALTLKAEPSFNVSLDPGGEHIIEKQYVHIGIAVDTPQGLVVPVIRDVDQKDIWQLAEESMELATKAREGKLMPRDMQGGCFTISSLGAIGGRGFTPIVNTPEVGILGVSKASVQPAWDGKKFVPRTLLPLSLSYDHRAINGADAGRFLTHLVGLLGSAFWE